MRKAQKKQALDFIELLGQAHDELKGLIQGRHFEQAMSLLAQCQEGALQLGELVEKTEGESVPTISLLESYCELAYQIYEELSRNEDPGANKAYKKLRQSLIRITNSVRNEIRIRREVVFLPYKASMWDSLESVWRAANEDPDCDAYVIPIPYFDRKQDGSFGEMHYEASQYPGDVPVIHYGEYDFESRRPDMIFIHNPYDAYNHVTSIDPSFYSDQLKKYTDCLVYIPYYATSGGMAEGQSLCPAYIHADYIVIQSERYRKFFDSRIPDSKFLPFGSPKFDSIIHKCQNPPAPPAEWAEKLRRGKVYFYNTSINGMLGNTDAFLKKMRYVFDTFQGRQDVCLLWRPHPLLESTFETLRGEYKPVYDALKREFVEKQIGILDETADMENAIALSDVYLGDGATSVTSLFGVAGKPLFLFNNEINTPPGEDDWRGERVNPIFDAWGNDRYQITRNNQLWFSEKNDYHYKFYMDLETGYSSGGYYMGAQEIGGNIYVLPGNARHLLIIKNKKIRKIEFRDQIAQPGAFYGYWYNEKHIFLLPNQYPHLIRFNLKTEEITYIEGVRDFNVRELEGKREIGGTCIYENEIVFASPENSEFLFLDMDTLKARVKNSGTTCGCGTQGIIPYGNELWLLPINGMTLACWNPKTGFIREYDDLPKNFKSVNWPYNEECRERPFSNIAFSREGEKENIVLSPNWGNMYVTLDRASGKMEEWRPPVPFKSRGKNGYFATGGMGSFLITIPQQGKADCRIWYAPERKLYDVNIDTKECREVEIEFDLEELKAHEPGYMEESEWMQYCLSEGALNSLKDLLDDNITGKKFDRERQIRAFSKVNANSDGTCGKELYRFLCAKI